jgi:hypothetical protein
MNEMKPLLYSINSFVPQQAPVMSVSSADGLYDKFYSPIEEYDPLSETTTVSPILTDMENACDYMIKCFSFGNKQLVGDYLKDLFMYRLLCVCGKQVVTGSTGSVTTNKYQDILDEIEARWTPYSFIDINAITTFTLIKAMA